MISTAGTNAKREFLCYFSVDIPAISVSARSREEILEKYPRLLVMADDETIEKYDPRLAPLGPGTDTAALNLSRLGNVRDSFMYRFDVDEDPRDGLAIQYGSARGMESFLCGLRDRNGAEKYFQIWSTVASEIRRAFPEVVIVPPLYGLVPPKHPSWGARHVVLDFPGPIMRILEGSAA